MNRFIKLFLTGLLAGFFMTAVAGPPPNGYPKQTQFLLFCHKDEATLLFAVSSSFHEYISATADVIEAEMKIFILEDPDDKSMSVVVTRDGETCLVFNGENIKHFDEPDHIPSDKDENI